jgi:hypothetical protein
VQPTLENIIIANHHYSALKILDWRITNTDSSPPTFVTENSAALRPDKYTHLCRMLPGGKTCAANQPEHGPALLPRIS